jgi:phosphate/sulfate permease
MTPESATRMKVITYALIGLGFAFLIGAHEWAVTTSSSADDSVMTMPFILAVAGMLSFVAAGLLARKLMKGGTSN